MREEKRVRTGRTLEEGEGGRVKACGGPVQNEDGTLMEGELKKKGEGR